MKKITLLLVIVLFGLAGCGRPPGSGPTGSGDKPVDFSISLNWSTGSLPEPQMHYSYSIEVGPSGAGRLRYQSGDKSLELDAPFAVNEENLNRLYTHSYEIGAFRKTREAGEPLDGGPDLSIYIQSGGKSYSFPSVSELSENERNIAYAIVDQLQELVPNDLWNEIPKGPHEGTDRTKGRFFCVVFINTTRNL